MGIKCLPRVSCVLTCKMVFYKMLVAEVTGRTESTIVTTATLPYKSSNFIGRTTITLYICPVTISYKIRVCHIIQQEDFIMY